MAGTAECSLLCDADGVHAQLCTHTTYTHIYIHAHAHAKIQTHAQIHTCSSGAPDTPERKRTAARQS